MESSTIYVSIYAIRQQYPENASPIVVIAVSSQRSAHHVPRLINASLEAALEGFVWATRIRLEGNVVSSISVQAVIRMKIVPLGDVWTGNALRIMGRAAKCVLRKVHATVGIVGKEIACLAIVC